MTQIWRLVLAAALLLLGASTACMAADNDVKQLELTGAYEEALRDAPTSPAAPGYAPTAQGQADQLAHEFRMRQEDDKLYQVGILSTLALVSLFIVLRFITFQPGYSAAHIVSATGLIFIIFGTILLVLMADTEQQLTAAIGILGAVAGYLFGSIRRGEGGKEGGKEGGEGK